MNSLTRHFGVMAALGGAVLAGCNAVEDVRDKSYTAVPAQTVVLSGTITGLGSKRSVTLQNNADSAGAQGFIAPAPAVATATPPDVPFSFGTVPQGSTYNITVKANPFGKICTVTNGTGTITSQADLKAHPITVNCTNDPAKQRYDLTVNLPNTASFFSGLPGATVNLATEEQIYAQPVTPGQTSVTFTGALLNATGQLTNFAWTVTATTTQADGTKAKCVVTGASSAAGTNPTGNITSTSTTPVAPRVGTSATQTVSACGFTIAGSVAYNLPPPGTGTVPAMPADGVTLDVRDTQNNVLTSYNVNAFGAFTVGGATPVLFPSNANSVYEIAVSHQPAGLTCIPADAGGVNFYTGPSLNNPVSVTSAGNTSGTTITLGSRLQIYCRAAPVGTRKLSGTYRLTSSTWTPVITSPTNPAPITSTYTPYDLSIQNTASSNMLTFFDDGTFLYGTHAASTQVEHGYYDYDPTAKTLRFTLITDTNTGVTFPGNFSIANSPIFTVGSGLLTTTNGLSATPGKIVSPGVTIPAGTAIGAVGGPGGTPPGVLHAAMTNVQFSTTTVAVTDTASQTVSRLTGTFGADPAASTQATANPNATNGTANTYPNATQRLDWVLTEPKSISHEMTGTWITQDHRRFWVWDFSTDYGTHVGVAGGAASMNDACFTIDDVHATSGIYTRRGTITTQTTTVGCIPFGRLSTTQAAASGYTFIGTVESVDYNTATSLPSGFTALWTPAGTQLPGYVGRMPGGQSAQDGRSPSPMHFYIGSAAAFAGDTKYFPTPTVPFSSWCTTEILAVRATSNDVPIDYPVYFCRSRVP